MLRFELGEKANDPALAQCDSYSEVCRADRVLGIGPRLVERWRSQGSKMSSFKWFPVGAEEELVKAANAVAKLKRPDYFPRLSRPSCECETLPDQNGGIFSLVQGTAGGVGGAQRRIKS